MTDNLSQAFATKPYDTATIKQYLESQKAALKERRSELKSEDPLMQEDRDLDNEPMTDAYEVSSHDRIKAIRDDLKDDLEKITRALEKIEENTYGICDTCGAEIDKTRLEAIPAATVCIECERSREMHVA